VKEMKGLRPKRACINAKPTMNTKKSKRKNKRERTRRRRWRKKKKHQKTSGDYDCLHVHRKVKKQG
jgi:hypothetical protein